MFWNRIATAAWLPAALGCLLATAEPAAAQSPTADIPGVPTAAQAPSGVHLDSTTGAFQAPPPDNGPISPPANAELFCKDRIDVQIMSGVQFAPSGLGPRSQTFDYLTEQIRFGRILTSNFFDGSCFRGDLEGIFELTTAPIVDGFGSIVIGPSALIRYNFVQPDARLIPYLQAGAGVVYNDAYKDPDQRSIGQSVEFFLEVGGGFHYRIGDNWTFDVESEIGHISNASLASRNFGINSVGGSLGFTFFFR